MARPGITYEQVQNAADTLIGRGDKPTIQAIRAELGSGSPNTIHRHLTAWRAAQAPAKREAAKLPDELAVALADEIERQAAAARADAEGDTLEARRTADALAEVGEGLEQHSDELIIQAEALKQERDEAVALRDSAHVENERLRADIDQLRISNDATQQALAEARNRTTTLTEQRDDLRQALTAIEKDAKTAEAGRVSAERSQAVAEAKLEAAEHQSVERLEALKMEQQARKADADAHQKSLHAAEQARQEDAQAHRQALSELRDEWKERLAASDTQRENAEHRASEAEVAKAKAEVRAKQPVSQPVSPEDKP